LLGSVERVAVLRVPAGAATLPAVPAGDPAGAGVEVAFRQFGSGPDLVLVAGEHATMSWWDPRLLLALAQQYTVTELDLPDTGFSGITSSTPTIESDADVVAGLVDELGLKSPAVVGWGLGGEIALALAQRHPGLVGRLVLVDSSLGGPGAVRPTAAVAREMASPTATPVELASLLFAPTLTASIDGWLNRTGDLPPDDLVASAVAGLAALQASAWSDTSLATGARAVSTPALVVVGAEDAVFPRADSAQLVTALGHSRELVLPGAGYGAIFQDEPQFLTALEAFTG
jgi:pimeloyl-ACP methyl ester carboxylesterase